ncbi:MAG: bacteriohemerythrin [Pseudolabrys sp.]|nr:bacteriohemerythrin [Pseudolabrys sp.]MDP2296824.1 bacteriohemerythrin [Pseudolabrys sp.]
MPLLQWKDNYSVGIEAVDHEHKELIELINQLYGELMAKGEPLTASAFFGDLIKAISAHFALEERFMRDHGYDQLPQHKEDHERLLDEIFGLMDEFERDDMASREDLAARLDAWFSCHFETHDARLHKAFGPHPD